MASENPPGGAPERRRYTFPRAHRLKRRRLIRPLFDRSRTDVGTLAIGCVRLLYRIAPPEEVGQNVPVQIGFAPGRRVRNAVERNRVRRLLREVYRVHQHTLADLFAQRNGVLTVMVLFRGDPAEAAKRVPRDLPRAVQRVAARLEADAKRGAGGSSSA